MKKIFFILGLFCICSYSAHAQQTITVSNNTAFDADYDNLKDAIDAANAGDIIMIQGSSGPYSIASSPPDTIDKAVLIYGPGYFLGVNENSNQYNNTGAIFDDIVIMAEGVYVSGLDIDFVDIYANNVVVQRNRINGIRLNSSNNVAILQNYIESYVTGVNASIGINGICDGLLIANNLFTTSASVANIYNYSNSSGSGIVRYNTFTRGAHMNNTVYENNIFLTGVPSANVNLGNSFFNNIFSISFTALTDINNNKEGVGTDLFIETTNSLDANYQVADGTAADNAAIDETDCGAFGGSEPYILSGIPAIPQIYFFSVPTATSQDLNVNVKVRTNN